MSKKKSKVIGNWPRYLLQWGVLAAIVLFLTGLIKAENVDPETYCPMGGLQAFATYVFRGSLPCSMSTLQIVVGLTLAAAIILFSKLFCGYVCPLGTIEDLLAKLRKFLHVKDVNIVNGSVADKALRIVKYALLFWIFYATTTSSELFCKSMDPYYALATGFHGEIVLWMSIVTLVLLFVGGFFVKNFWCRYICPLGAISNSFKFWLWMGVLCAVYYLLLVLGVNVPWWLFLAAYSIAGYLLEILCAKPKLQVLHVCKDDAVCNKCGLCTRNCPYNIDIPSFEGKVNSVDCTLCGECVASCNTNALHIGVNPKKRGNCFTFLLPAILTVVLAVFAIIFGNKTELPTINETWGIYSDDSQHTQLIDPSTLQTVTLEDLKSIHCYGSSMAFKGKLEKVRGVYGVKTYVKTHRATITYDPAVTSPEKIQEAIYVPSCYQCSRPDYKAVPELKVITIRTERMPSATDVNFLGIQFMQFDKLIYGVDSQWECPLIVHMYVDPAFDKDEKWIKEIVNKPTLDITLSSGEVKSTPLGFKFVRMEDEITTIKTTDFLLKMFHKPFKAELRGKYPQGDSLVVKKRSEHYAGKPQFIYEFTDKDYSHMLVANGLPYVSNHLSTHEGIISVCTKLNAEYLPCLQIRFAAPMTEEEIWKLLTMEEWTITYAEDDVRQVPARMSFEAPGVVFPYVEPDEK